MLPACSTLNVCHTLSLQVDIDAITVTFSVILLNHFQHKITFTSLIYTIPRCYDTDTREVMILTHVLPEKSSTCSRLIACTTVFGLHGDMCVKRKNYRHFATLVYYSTVAFIQKEYNNQTTYNLITCMYKTQ